MNGTSLRRWKLIKEYGAFIQNTVDPLLKEVKEVLLLCNKYDINVNKAFTKLLISHVITCLINGVMQVIVTLGVIWIVWKICQS